MSELEQQPQQQKAPKELTLEQQLLQNNPLHGL